METEIKKVYVGKNGHDVYVHAAKEGYPLPLEPSLKVYSHSPTGFAWGYLGSGAAQLALALLLDATDGDEEAASQYHQLYKEEVIANIPGDAPFVLNDSVILAWLEQKGCKQLSIVICRSGKPPIDSPPGTSTDVCAKCQTEICIAPSTKRFIASGARVRLMCNDCGNKQMNENPFEFRGFLSDAIPEVVERLRQMHFRETHSN